MMKIIIEIDCDDVTDLLNHLDVIKEQVRESVTSRHLNGISKVTSNMAADVNSKKDEYHNLTGKHRMLVR